MSDTQNGLTPEENAAAVDYLRRLSAFVDGTDRRCLHCNQPITEVVKPGRSIYAQPCGCRLYQGTVPKWAKSEPRTTRTKGRR